jgi:hypothetical protein
MQVTFPPFSFIKELPTSDWEALERMIDEAGLAAVVSALANISGYKAQHLRESWQDEASAKRWDKASNVLAKVGYTRGLTA